MKRILVILLAIVAIPPLANAAEKPAADEVVVGSIDKPLPHSENERSSFLWQTFANKPEEKKFASYTTQGWKDNFTAFQDALVRKALSQKLDTNSLCKALGLILKDSPGLAYLPVGAHQTSLEHKPVWILVLKWEAQGNPQAMNLEHIRVFAFDQKSLKQVGYVTCR